jgi:RNA recognition motif-containing protein
MTGIVSPKAAERRMRQRSDKMSRKLYVGNLSYQTEAPALQQLFEQAGTVETVKVMKDTATGRSRGFAFVEMGSDEEAARAISELNARTLEGRTLTVNEARPKTEHGGGFLNTGSRRNRSEPRW